MPALELITSGNEFRFNSAGPRDQVKLESAAELRLESDRLDLVPCSPQACLASLQGPRVLSRLAGIEVPPTWPPRELTDALALYARGLDGGDSRRGWGIWLMISQADRMTRGGLGRAA